MKVLHLGCFDRRGGASIAAHRQHQALIWAGIESKMWVRFGVTGEPDIQVFHPIPSPLARMRRFVRRSRLGLELRASEPLAEFVDERGDLGGEIRKALPEADIYNIQFSQGFLDHATFFRAVPTTKPIVVTLHEMSWFTGGCTYSGACRRYEAECVKCPLLRRSGAKDFSNRGWNRRRELYRSHPKLHFVADSHWIAQQARGSRLLRGYPVSVIHYGLDTTIFRPLDKDAIRTALGVPQDTAIVAFAAASVTDPRKGMKELLEALGMLKQELFLLTWGRNVPVVGDELAHLHLGNLESDHLAALAYNAADVFVMPSLEEAFGQTALEAVACGVPVVAFDVGGIPDTVKPGLNGYLVPRGDSHALAAGIDKALNDRVMAARWRRRATDWTEENFSYTKNAGAYINLYNRMLNKQIQ